jgi:hypothetical protein
MSNFRQFDRATGFLLPPSLDEWLPERHLARFVVEVIDGLDLSAMVKSYREIHANASRHSALSYEHAGKIEAQLKAEVAELLARAEAADQADVLDGMPIPEELARREERLAKLAEARAKLDARAKERFERKMAEHRAKLAARAPLRTHGRRDAANFPTAPADEIRHPRSRGDEPTPLQGPRASADLCLRRAR